MGADPWALATANGFKDEYAERRGTILSSSL